MRSIGRLNCASALLALIISVAPVEAQVSFDNNDNIDVSDSAVGPVITTGPQTIALADINKDQKADILAVGTDENGNPGVNVYLNDGTGAFPDDPVFYGTGPGPVAVVVGDFNNDGNLDFATANKAESAVTVYLGDGTGSFKSQRDFAVDPNPVGLVARDFNGDRKDDLAVLSSGSVHLLKSTSDGTSNDFADFVPANVNTNGRGGFAIAFGLFDNNNNWDLAISNRDSNQVSVLLGNGDGTFQNATLYNIGSQPEGIVTGRLQGGGSDDIAVVDSGEIADQNVSLLYSNGDGTFQNDVRTTAETDSHAIAAGDIDGDGRIDLAVTTTAGGEAIVILQNNPDAPGNENGFLLLSNVNDLTLDDGAVAVQSGSLDQSGKIDLIALGVNTTDSIQPCEIGTFINTTGGGPSASPTNTPTPGGSPTSTPPASSTPTATAPTPTFTATPTVTSTATATPIPIAPYGLCNTGSGEISPPLDLGRPVAVAAGDFNRDGSSDIAVADNQNNRVVILLTNINTDAPTACGVLGLTKGTELTGVTAPVALLAQDLDVDGKLDLAVVDANGVTIFYGDGSGGFGQPIPLPKTGAMPQSIATADFNRDGLPDIAVANNGSSFASIFINLGNRTFQQPGCEPPVGTTAGLIVTQDLNSDGRADFAVASGNTNDLSVFLQRAPTGTPTPGISTPTPGLCTQFRTLTPLDLPPRPSAVVVGIFDFSDRVPDLAIVTALPNVDGSLLVYYGKSMGGSDVVYQQVNSLMVPRPSGSTIVSAPSALGVGDVNRDGRSDLVVADKNNNDVVIYLANSDGGFGPNLIPFPIGGIGPVSLVMTDLEGDGRADIVLANAGDGTISVLVSSRPPPTPPAPPTATPTQTGTPTASGTATAMSTPTSTPSCTPTVTPSRTPSSTVVPTAVPTATIKPGTISLSSCALDPMAGARAGGATALWAIAGIAWLARRHRRRSRSYQPTYD